MPVVPLLLHAALGRPGDAVREDLMRAVTHLGLTFAESRLPPDHLALTVEVLATALDRSETAIADGLCARYLLPWCDFAVRRLDDASALRQCAERFSEDLAL